LQKARLFGSYTIFCVLDDLTVYLSDLLVFSHSIATVSSTASTITGMSLQATFGFDGLIAAGIELEDVVSLVMLGCRAGN
jgi:hypothetical protein